MQQHLASAADILRHGGLVAYPTEAVYGLGCDPFDEAAVMRLLAVKQRPVAKGLILLAADLPQLLPYIKVTAAQQAKLASSWPAPVTFLVEASERVPAWVRGEHAKVAVRVSAHPLARQLAALAGGPIISTSANISGRPSARNRFQVARQLGEQVDFVVTGDCDRASKPSTIIDLETGRTLRA
ncbi:Sua5/YciO/YrdC/YwlC family protein [Alcanivorax hongdengensis A-11-3]|uniref:Threonylcarbamoyl-AMP synthase n=1 Tax=Alcanivorax hongdengensis A-11-3 TaxID=1177179 RepID=L0WBZ8_9GAMM|nr:L-threonylcarbamoyladenylate synthase [Alcanivorax hongdengensis]EKF74303.1 Sua5/YciO/YrdC/YwlC family protein [Alcanivorax hongdengensis A-11-3]